MRRSRFVLAVAASSVIAGCSSLRESMPSWLGGSPAGGAPAPTQAPIASRQGEVYYAGIDGLAVYAQPSTSSEVVGHLTLYDRVTRSRLEHGYAYVAADRTGLQGWVDNAQLVWRLPATKNAAVRAGAPAPGSGSGAGAKEAAGTEQPAAADSAQQVEATPTSTPVTPAAAPTMQAAAPTPRPKRANPEPSIFDPY